MNNNLVSETTAQGAAAALARLAAPHGYRIDGDRVHIHARLIALSHTAHERAWALQLRACSAAPVSARDLAGHVVAEIALPPMAEVADETEHIELNAFAHLPAGQTGQVMVLVLASGRAGQFDEVHDFHVYPRTEQFLLPRMTGKVGYRIAGDQVHLMVERIVNPQPARHCTGTLALELWALPAPYTGGGFQGMPLAGVAIKPLPGQSEIWGNTHTLPYAAPGAGQWHYVLMLREWTAEGYRTRDFTNFAHPVGASLSPEPAPQAAETPAPVVIPVVEVAHAAAAPIQAPPPAPTITVEPVAATAAKPAAVTAPAAGAVEVAKAPPAPVTTAASVATVAPVKAAELKAPATTARQPQKPSKRKKR